MPGVLAVAGSVLIAGLGTSAPGFSIAYRTLCVKGNGKYIEIPDARLEKKKESMGGRMIPRLGGVFFRSAAVVGFLGKVP